MPFLKALRILRRIHGWRKSLYIATALWLLGRAS
jgi:hypothetical protein